MGSKHQLTHSYVHENVNLFTVDLRHVSCQLWYFYEERADTSLGFGIYIIMYDSCSICESSLSVEFHQQSFVCYEVELLRCFCALISPVTELKVAADASAVCVCVCVCV